MIEVSAVRKSSEFFRLIPPVDPSSGPDCIEIHSHRMPIHYRRHGRARNYVLRLHTNRTVMVTIPRHGTRKFAREFVASRKSWLEKQWRIMETRNVPPQMLRPGMEILLHGRSVALEVGRRDTRWELENPPGCGSQSKEPLGFVLLQRHDFAQLAVDPTACAGAGLYHRA
jgi:hypothetical protein